MISEQWHSIMQFHSYNWITSGGVGWACSLRMVCLTFNPIETHLVDFSRWYCSGVGKKAKQKASIRPMGVDKLLPPWVLWTDAYD